MDSEKKNRPSQRPEDPAKHNAQQEREYREQKAGHKEIPFKKNKTTQNSIQEFENLEKKLKKEEE